MSERITRIYHGWRQNPALGTVSPLKVTVSVYDKNRGCYVRGGELDPKQSQELYNHSPDGFNWGYHGSGPAQLALALMLDATGDKKLSLRWHQSFKTQFVATWGDDWLIDDESIKMFLQGKEKGAIV